jgi:aryl-alcohol dehydrogenase-like predicted oxidoreductase
VSPATVSLSWAMAKQGISNTLVGSRNQEELLSNIQAAEFVLPQETYETLNAASLPVWEIVGNNPDYYQNREESRIW